MEWLINFFTPEHLLIIIFIVIIVSVFVYAARRAHLKHLKRIKKISDQYTVLKKGGVEGDVLYRGRT